MNSDEIDQLPEEDRRLVEFFKWLRDQEYDTARRVYNSFYYDYGPIRDLMETTEGPGPIQYDYPSIFQQEG